MFEVIRADIYRYTAKQNNLDIGIQLLKSSSFKFLFYFRLISLSKSKIFFILFYFFYRRYTTKYGMQIPLSVKIGKGIHFPHFGGIVINSKSIIGKNCTIMHNVTIGNSKSKKNKGNFAPRILDEVYIGPGAVIVGNITIGDRVLIAPNAFVNFDVPNDSIVIGNPAIIKFKKYASEDYITNRYDY